jgi:hypothetical protein
MGSVVAADETWDANAAIVFELTINAVGSKLVIGP